MEQVMMITKMAPAPAPISVFHIDDDGGSFHRLVQETRRLVFGTTDDIETSNNLVQFRVLQGLVNRASKGGATTAFKKTNSSLRSCSFVEQGKNKKPILLKVVLNRKSEEGFEKEGAAPFQKETNCLRRCGTVVEEQKKNLKLVLKRKSEDIDDHDHQNNSNKKMMRSNCGGGLIKKCTGLEISKEQPDPLSTKMEKIIQEERGTDIRLMIRKRVTETDLKQHNGRLSIAPSQLKDKHLTFLTDDERGVVAKFNNPLPVKLIEPCGHKSSLCLVKWSYNSTFSYMLIAGWNDVLKRKHFKADDIIQIWSFRVSGELYLAIDKVRDAPSI